MLGSPARADQLKPVYSPPADNGGGTEPARTGVIDIFQRADTVDGDYGLRGTSARRFTLVLDSIAERQRRAEVLTGYNAVAGRSALVLAPEQKTQAVTYPDLVQGTRQSAVVYDNARLSEIASDSARVVTFEDTNAPVYGDLRLANISQSTVTIATGDKNDALYDTRNFALPTADTGSTLYNVTGNSTIVYDSVTATMHGTDQDGLSQMPTTVVQALVTDYSGVTFGGDDRVVDLASLKRYNSNLIAADERPDHARPVRPAHPGRGQHHRPIRHRPHAGDPDLPPRRRRPATDCHGAEHLDVDDDGDVAARRRPRHRRRGRRQPRHRQRVEP